MNGVANWTFDSDKETVGLRTLMPDAPAVTDTRPVDASEAVVDVSTSDMLVVVLPSPSTVTLDASVVVNDDELRLPTEPVDTLRPIVPPLNGTAAPPGGVMLPPVTTKEALDGNGSEAAPIAKMELESPVNVTEASHTPIMLFVRVVAPVNSTSLLSDHTALFTCDKYAPARIAP